MIPVSEIFEKIKNRMRDRGVAGEQEYYAIVEEVLDEYEDSNMITDDDNIEEVREKLEEMWREVGKTEFE